MRIKKNKTTSCKNKKEYRFFSIRYPLNAKRSGFSLIELIMVMVIIAIIAGVSATVGFQAVYDYLIVRENIEATEIGRLALRRMVRDIRLIDEHEISLADDEQLTFRNVYGNVIDIQLSSTTLTLNGNTLANNVTSFSFSYYDKTNGLITPMPLSSTDIEDIHWILISIQVTINNEIVNLRSQVFPRDFR